MLLSVVRTVYLLLPLPCRTVRHSSQGFRLRYHRMAVLPQSIFAFCSSVRVVMVTPASSSFCLASVSAASCNSLLYSPASSAASVRIFCWSAVRLWKNVSPQIHMEVASICSSSTRYLATSWKLLLARGVIGFSTASMVFACSAGKHRPYPYPQRMLPGN